MTIANNVFDIAIAFGMFSLTAATCNYTERSGQTPSGWVGRYYFCSQLPRSHLMPLAGDLLSKKCQEICDSQSDCVGYEVAKPPILPLYELYDGGERGIFNCKLIVSGYELEDAFVDPSIGTGDSLNRCHMEAMCWTRFDKDIDQDCNADNKESGHGGDVWLEDDDDDWVNIQGGRFGDDDLSFDPLGTPMEEPADGKLNVCALIVDEKMLGDTFDYYYDEYGISAEDLELEIKELEEYRKHDESGELLELEVSLIHELNEELDEKKDSGGKDDRITALGKRFVRYVNGGCKNLNEVSGQDDDYPVDWVDDRTRTLILKQAHAECAAEADAAVIYETITTRGTIAKDTFGWKLACSVLIIAVSVLLAILVFTATRLR